MASAAGKVTIRSARNRLSSRRSSRQARSSSRAMDRSSPPSLAMRDQPPQPGVAVQRKQAADPRVLGVVLLAGRTPPARHQLRVDRQHRIPGLHQRLNQQAMPGLDHHPHLSRVGLQPRDPLHQSRHRLRAVLHPQHRDDSRTRAAERHQMKLFRPVDPYSQHITLPMSSIAGNTTCGEKRGPRRRTPRSPREAPRRADRQSSGDGNLLGVRPPGPSPGDAVSIKSSKDKRPKRSPGEDPHQEGRGISARSASARGRTTLMPGKPGVTSGGPGGGGPRLRRRRGVGANRPVSRTARERQ